MIIFVISDRHHDYHHHHHHQDQQHHRHHHASPPHHHPISPPPTSFLFLIIIIFIIIIIISSMLQLAFVGFGLPLKFHSNFSETWFFAHIRAFLCQMAFVNRMRLFAEAFSAVDAPLYSPTHRLRPTRTSTNRPPSPTLLTKLISHPQTIPSPTPHEPAPGFLPMGGARMVVNSGQGA